MINLRSFHDTWQYTICLAGREERSSWESVSGHIRVRQGGEQHYVFLERCQSSDLPLDCTLIWYSRTCQCCVFCTHVWNSLSHNMQFENRQPPTIEQSQISREGVLTFEYNIPLAGTTCKTVAKVPSSVLCDRYFSLNEWFDMTHLHSLLY